MAANRECTDRNGVSLVATTDTNGYSVYTFGNLYPDQEYGKKATITNIGTENAYVGATITITSDSTIGTLLKDEATIRAFLSGLVNAGDGYAISGMDNIEATDKVITLVITKNDALTTAENSKTAVLMEKVCVNKDWDNAEMAQLGNFNIVINAYAVQTVGFTTAAAALHAAFGSVFP